MLLGWIGTVDFPHHLLETTMESFVTAITNYLYPATACYHIYYRNGGAQARDLLVQLVYLSAE